MKGQFKLFRLAGITVYLHWSWFLVAVIEIQARRGAYTAPGWNVLEYLALFALVTMHEYGHALACRGVGGRPDRILLWPFGGIAYVDPPQRPGATLWSLAAGPLVNVALAWPLWWLAQTAPGWAGGDLATLLEAVALINLVLLAFNLLPVYPLDGGQILRSLLWYGLGRARSLMAAVWIGWCGVAGLVWLGLRWGDLWLLAITAFIGFNCWNGLKQARALAAAEKIPRRAGFACPSCHSAPPIGAYWRCGQCQQGFDGFVPGGACPHCGQAFAHTACLDCGRASPVAAWSRTVGSPARERPLPTGA